MFMLNIHTHKYNTSHKYYTGEPSVNHLWNICLSGAYVQA